MRRDVVLHWLRRRFRKQKAVRLSARPSLSRSIAFPCAHCGMLLGGVAQRRGHCPRCRATLDHPR